MDPRWHGKHVRASGFGRAAVSEISELWASRIFW
jgi:hypothetical protein